MPKHRRPELGRLELIRFYARRERGEVSFGYVIEPHVFELLQKVGGERVGELCKMLATELGEVFEAFGESSGLAVADPDQAERGGSAPPAV